MLGNAVATQAAQMSGPYSNPADFERAEAKARMHLYLGLASAGLLCVSAAVAWKLPPKTNSNRGFEPILERDRSSS